jgi:hypothetical protein
MRPRRRRLGDLWTAPPAAVGRRRSAQSRSLYADRQSLHEHLPNSSRSPAPIRVTGSSAGRSSMRSTTAAICEDGEIVASRADMAEAERILATIQTSTLPALARAICGVPAIQGRDAMIRRCKPSSPISRCRAPRFCATRQAVRRRRQRRRRHGAELRRLEPARPSVRRRPIQPLVADVIVRRRGRLACGAQRRRRAC